MSKFLFLSAFLVLITFKNVYSAPNHTRGFEKHQDHSKRFYSDINSTPTTVAKNLFLTTESNGTEVHPTSSCPPGGIWSNFSFPTCNDTCGMCGYLQVRRYCVSLDQGCPCDGPFTQSLETRCGSETCNFPRPICCDGYIREYNATSGSYVCVQDKSSTLQPIIITATNG